MLKARIEPAPGGADDSDDDGRVVKNMRQQNGRQAV